MSAPIPPNDAERIAALVSLELLDTADEQFFNEIVSLASTVCGTPMAAVSLIDECRQWFKARIGLEPQETPREQAFCAHAILAQEPLLIEDALADPRFVCNPLVTSGPEIRSYAGVPLVTDCGFALGTLCALGTKPRQWSEADVAALTSLARLTIRHIELRRSEKEAALLRSVSEKLHSTETRFLSIVSNMTEGVVVQDPEGQLIWANAAAETILGLTTDEMIGRTSMDPRWRSLFEDGTDMPGEAHFPMVALRTGQPTSGVMSVEQPNRRRRTLSVHSQPIIDAATGRAVQVVSTFLDITDERISQTRLADNEARLKLALSLANAVTWDIDVKRGNVFVSDSLNSFFGRDVTDEALTDFWALIYEEDRPAVQAAWIEHLRGGPPMNIDHRVVRADGMPVWVRAYAIAQGGKDGRPASRFIGMFQDISTAKAQEQALAAALERAEAASMAKSAFLANMSHEIRTPLNGVIGLAGALAGTVLEPTQREMVELIENSGRVLERLLSDILDVSKVEAGRFELEVAPFDLREEIEAAAHVMRIRAEERGIDFAIQYGPTARGVFEGDGVRLKQVVSNLVSNAIKFTESGGVTMRVGIAEARDDSVSRLHLEVEDTGIGFDADAAETLFQRFSQADTSITRRFGGTGLGLAISKAIVDLMGGQIHALSEPGVGTCFTVDVPLPRSMAITAYDAREHEVEARKTSLGPQNAAPLRILVAEDHPTNQRVIALLLEPMGVDLTIVENGQLCLDAHAVGTFDLILMDMQMPVMDGIEATKAIRRRERASGGRRTPIAMLSANALAAHRELASDAGVDHYIPKPISPAALIEGIEMTLGAAAERAAA